MFQQKYQFISGFRTLKMSDEGWQIIYFIDEDSIEVVPKKWVYTDDDENEVYSFWPNIRSGTRIVTAIKTKEDPKDDWQRHKVKLMSNKVYINFSVATMKASKATYTDNITTQSESEDFITNRKRLIRKPSRYDTDESDEDDGSDIAEIPNPPKINLSQINKERNKKIPRNEAKIINPCRSEATSDFSSTNSTLSYQQVEVTQCIEEAPEKDTRINDLPRNDIETSASGIRNTNIDSSSSISASSIQHSEEYKYIIKQLHILNGRVQEQTQLILTLLNRSVEGEKLVETGNEVQETFDELPVKNEDDLDKIENRLKNEMIMNILIKKFASVGGDDLKDLIRRIMPRIIDDEILRQYSWIGGKGKKKFSLLNLTGVIKGVCKITPNTKSETEKKIESYLSVYLSKATERYARREKKKNKEAEKENIE